MKKFLLLALLFFSVIAVIAGCSEDNNKNTATDNGTTTTPPDEGETGMDIPVKVTNEAEIGKTTTLSYKFKNQYNHERYYSIEYKASSTALNITSTTCGTLDTASNTIEGMLKANQECTIEYTFAPTNLSTEILSLVIGSGINPEYLCNNLTEENIILSEAASSINIINYAKNSNGEKSADVEDIDFIQDYNISINHLETPKKYSTQKIINFDKGIYNIDDSEIGPSKGKLTINPVDSNCTITDKTLEVLNNNSCQLFVDLETTMPSNFNIYFTSSSKKYTASINYKSKYKYDVKNITKDNVNINYINILSTLKLYSYTYLKNVYIITNNMDYKLQGTNADKFILKPTPYDGCIVSPTNILIGDKKSCYIYFDLTDDAKQTDGDYTAQISSTTTGVTLNINGSSIANPLEYFKNNICSAKP